MSYVVITGASAGIGERFARALAAEKQNLILVARREERLNTLATELKQQHGIEAIVLKADLANEAGAEALARQINDVGWVLSGLINNAGFGDRGAFADLGLERQLSMIQVNITSLVSLTWQLLPSLRKQPGSFVINVASTAAFQAGPNMAIYYATKAFVLSFSEALHEELRGAGVSVSTLCPGATDSEFATEAHMTNTKLFKAGTMTAEAVVKKSLAQRRKAIVIPGLRNLLMVWSGKLSPRAVTRRLAGWLQA
ncbi:SDR family oxidoreductase [Marinobacter flavimaris]|uniref:SDR family oxidoreductase n=1 Tax=Marinobacter flavimaris TaxID=262076 RepID=A0A3D8H2E3_9GAMM|nr:SDR family oxidoreductase [Marinobacter flavimaris]PPI80441.1 short-chain dehydrogenase [Marinobacter flavimaris]RDU40880.1 SDR family oxidoreductase [Marinobacter flavimaris]